MTDDHATAITPPIVDALVELSFAILDILSRSAAEHDLSLTQLRLLGILRDRTPTMAELAEFLRLDRSSVTGLIDRAERRGLVARRTSSADARVTIIDLAPTGVRIGQEVVARVSTRIERLVQDFPEDDRSHLIRLAASITATSIETVALS